MRERFWGGGERERVSEGKSLRKSVIERSEREGDRKRVKESV